MRSLISASGQVIDCRQLIFEGTFFSLDHKQADQLAKDYYQSVNDFFQDKCILDWKFEDRSFRDFDDALTSKKMKNGAYSFYFDGNVLCESVYNKTTFRKYVRNTVYPPVPREFIGSRESADYGSYYETKILSKRMQAEHLKKSIIDLFDLEGKLYQGESQFFDLGGLFSNIPMEGTEGLFYGSFCLKIACYCLEREETSWTEKLCEFAKQLMKKYKNINIHIEINPEEGQYARYFGFYPGKRDMLLKKFSLRYYARYLYFTEIGWGHFICPETRKFGITLPKTEDNTLIKTEELTGGGLYVCVNKPIMETLISDLKEMKKCIYNTVMPRENIVGFDWRMRRYWEYVPVFENELSIADSGVKFVHYGEIDPARICRAMEVDIDKLE